MIWHQQDSDNGLEYRNPAREVHACALMSSVLILHLTRLVDLLSLLLPPIVYFVTHFIFTQVKQKRLKLK